MIRGQFLSGYFQRLPTVEVVLSVPKLTNLQPSITFVVDTGAKVTLLFPQDIINKLKVEPDQISHIFKGQNSKQVYGTTGRADYYITEASFGFMDNDAGLQILRSDIYVPKSANSSSRVPSILGWNILAYFNLSISRRNGDVLLRLLSLPSAQNL